MYSICARLSRKISIEQTMIKLAAIQPQIYAPSIIKHVSTNLEAIIQGSYHKIAFDLLRPCCERPPNKQPTLNELVDTVQTLLIKSNRHEYEFLATTLLNSCIVTKNLIPALKLLNHQYSHKNREVLHKYINEVKQMLGTKQDWTLFELSHIGIIISDNYDPSTEAKYFERLEQCMSDPMMELSSDLLVPCYELICTKSKNKELALKCFELISTYFFSTFNVQLSDIMRIVVASASMEAQVEIWEKIKGIIESKMYTTEDIEGAPYILTFAQAYTRCPLALIPIVFIESFKSYFIHQRHKLNKAELTYVVSILGSFEEFALQSEALSMLNAIPKT